jgi:hypothetical protein
MSIFRTIFSYELEKKFILFYMQLALSGVALGILAWHVVTYIKIRIVGSMYFLYPWTYIFFHPIESGLVNYLFLCVVLGMCGLVIYIFWNKRTVDFINGKLKKTNPIILFISIIFSVFSLLTVHGIFFIMRVPFSVMRGVILFSEVMQNIFGLTLISCAPLVILINSDVSRAHDPDGKPSKKLLLLSLLLLVLICLEPLQQVRGPVYLMNEYPDLYGETYVKGRYVNNKDFLGKLKDEDADTVKLFFDLKFRLDGSMTEFIKNADIDFIRQFRFINLEPAQEYLNSLATIEGENLLRPIVVQYLDKEFFDVRGYLNNLRNIDVEAIKQFYQANLLEYMHQNMSRGQINHIQHVLNPINEYQLGKPLKHIYMQYGLGNTFIMKWTMDLFGGLSLQNYHKCYIYYIIYFVTFLLMLYFLFRDWLYVVGVFAILAGLYFYNGFNALILAPGIIPTIHLFDATVIILLLLSFRYNSLISVGFVALFSLLAIIINQQFGMMLAVALFVTIMLYIFENKHGKRKYFWLLNLLMLFILSLFVFKFASAGTLGSDIFQYLFLGLFSWPPHSIVILLTVCYIIVSYFFMLLLKKERNYFKYIYLFIFLYTQNLFIYYYWAGLPNHLPMVLPFLGLQIFLMIFVAQKLIFRERTILRRVLSMTAKGIIFLALLFVIASAVRFYGEKWLFEDNFMDHKVYHWEFERAKLITTIDPLQVEESISLIKKYSEGSDAGIFIISQYDNFFPFLAKRFSLMPFFDMHWYVLSEKKVSAAIDKLKSEKPGHIFVDNDVDKKMADPWAKLYKSNGDNKERASRFGRYSELLKIFEAIVSDYEKIDGGELISVYKRRVIK